MQVNLVMHMIHRQTGTILTAFTNKQQDQWVIFEDRQKILYNKCGQVIKQIADGCWKINSFTKKHEFDILCTTVNDESCWERVDHLNIQKIKQE